MLYAKFGHFHLLRNFFGFNAKLGEILSKTSKNDTIIKFWTTWLETCFYFAENYGNFGQFLSILKDEEDTYFISSSIDNYNDPVLIQNFIFISNFRPLTEAVTKLQSRQSLVESLTIVQKLRSDLTLDPYKSKLEAILKKNPDLQKFIEVSNVLSGKTVKEWQNYMKDAEKFKNAQIVSVKIEFSQQWVIFRLLNDKLCQCQICDNTVSFIGI